MTSATPPEQPNVLFVICDQLRADHLGFAGNPVVRTPNIDTIAAGGTVFDRAYVNNPVCMPNRSTIMTGRMPSAHGVVFNDRSLDPNVNTFVGAAARGRLAHRPDRQVAPAARREPGARWSISARRPACSRRSRRAGTRLEHQERYETGEVVAPDDFYGFGHIELTLGHGAMTGAHHYQWARAKGIEHDAAALRARSHGRRRRDGRATGGRSIRRRSPRRPTRRSFVTERTIDFIETSRRPTASRGWRGARSPTRTTRCHRPSRGSVDHDPADIELPVDVRRSRRRLGRRTSA